MVRSPVIFSVPSAPFSIRFDLKAILGYFGTSRKSELRRFGGFSSNDKGEIPRRADRFANQRPTR